MKGGCSERAVCFFKVVFILPTNNLYRVCIHMIKLELRGKSEHDIEKPIFNFQNYRKAT